MEGNLSDLGWQGEDDVEIANGQKVGFALGEPCARSSALALWTVPVAAGVIGDAPMSAVITGLDMASERSGAAGLDRRHDLELIEAQMPRVGSPVSRASSAEDIGDLERGRHCLSRWARSRP